MLKNKYGENIFVNFKDLKYNKNGMVACCFFSFWILRIKAK